MKPGTPCDDDLEHAIHEPVALVPYDPTWPVRFEDERGRLLDMFPEAFVAIEHFGSTAVPGLEAKPVIDLLGGIESIDHADALIVPLCGFGYVTSDAYNATLTSRRWLMRHANGRRTHHLHLVEYGGDEWRDRLAFRDALRADPGLAGRYAAFKRELAREHADDREAYTEAKETFVRTVLLSIQGE